MSPSLRPPASWQKPALTRIGALRDVAEQGGNGNGRWTGGCQGKACFGS